MFLEASACALFVKSCSKEVVVPRESRLSFGIRPGQQTPQYVHREGQQRHGCWQSDKRKETNRPT